MNPDLAGWIKIEGTKVDYPVMQTSTNNKDYYLKRDFDKQDSVRGCIYAVRSATWTSPATTSPSTATTWPTAACSTA